MLFTAGQIALDPESGEMSTGDVQVQTRQVLSNIKAILETAGTDLGQVDKTTVYLQDMNDFAAMNQVYGSFFGEDPPARSTVEVARLSLNALVEIDAVAQVP